MLHFVYACIFSFFLFVSQAQAYEFSDLRTWVGDPQFQVALRDPDPEKAVAAFKKLYDNGNVFAGHALAERYLSGSGVKKDPQKSINLLQEIANQGFGPSQGFLGSIYLQGFEGIPAQPDKAVPLIVQAIGWGHTPSMFDLGLAYLKGQATGGSGQLYEGYKWISRAARQGHSGAKSVQTSLEKKYGVPKPQGQNGLVVEQGIRIDPLAANMGFTEAFADLHYASPFKDAAIIKEIKTSRLGKHPIYYYELSRRLINTDAEEAVYWTLVGGYRMRYHAKRCTDKTALGSVQMLPMAMNTKKLATALDKLTASGRAGEIYKKAVMDASAMPLDTDPSWVCRTGMRTIMARMNGEAETDLLKPQATWANINDTLKTETLALIESKYPPKP